MACLYWPWLKCWSFKLWSNHFGHRWPQINGIPLYYHNFLPLATELLKPLHHAIASSSPRSMVDWTLALLCLLQLLQVTCSDQPPCSCRWQHFTLPAMPQTMRLAPSWSIQSQVFGSCFAPPVTAKISCCQTHMNCLVNKFKKLKDRDEYENSVAFYLLRTKPQRK